MKIGAVAISLNNRPKAGEVNSIPEDAQIKLILTRKSSAPVTCAATRSAVVSSSRGLINVF